MKKSHSLRTRTTSRGHEALLYSFRRTSMIFLPKVNAPSVLFAVLSAVVFSSFGGRLILDQASQPSENVPLALGHLDVQRGLDLVEVQKGRSVVALRQSEAE